MDARIRYASRLSIILTERCNIACSHCLPECSPKTTETLPWALIEQIIRGAHADERRRLTTVAFTGGEPFLDVPLLARAIALCSELGLESTVMTNGFWATTGAAADAMLARLPGLTRLGLSTDSFHQEFIPVGRIEHAVAAAHAIALDCSVRVCHLDDPAGELETVRQQLIDVAGWYELEHQPVQPLGRARATVEYERIFSYDPERACCRSADTHAVNPSGEVSACCGATGSWRGPHPLKFGNAATEPIAEILHRASRSTALHAVRLWGPAGLLQLAQQEARLCGQSLPTPPIANICELCEFVVADAGRAALLERAVARPEVRREIAVARLVDLGETDSLEDA